MSLKHANDQGNSFSLVNRLMLFYSISTIGLLGGISLFLYPLFVKFFEHLHGHPAAVMMSALCYRKVIITLLIGSLFSILMGYLIARKGLKRLQEFEHKIDQINASSMDARLNIQEWPNELKTLGGKFNIMLDRIQSSFEQLSQFSSDIAHELRTPIHNLQGITELELVKHHHSDDQRRLLETYMVEYQHLGKLIENLLFLARSDHGNLMLDKQELEARSEIQSICDYYQILADEKNITIACEGDAKVYADLTFFKRVISNLLSNALRHTPEEGRITINIQTLGIHTYIAVHDTGEGIPKESLARVFDRFYRADSSRSSRSGGLGLGLAIVKSILNLHQGSVHIESVAPGGTTVYLQMPLA